MRTLTTHHTNPVNAKISVTADERNPDNGNASHVYSITWNIHDRPTKLYFQNGPIAQEGINGLTNEILLAIVIDRLEGFQSSKYACEENALALAHCLEALSALESRTRARTERGVEGTHEV